LDDLKNYVWDLAGLLEKATLSERKAFLHSFIERIIVKHLQVKLDYIFPIITEKGRTSKTEILPMYKTGSPIKPASDVLLLSQNRDPEFSCIIAVGSSLALLPKLAGA